MKLDWVVRRLTSETALGLLYPGAPASGYQVNINVIGFDRLMVHTLENL